MQKSSKELQRWLELYHCAGVGVIGFQKYLDADYNLIKLPDDIKTNPVAVKRDLEWLATNQSSNIITLADIEYPQLLKKIANPPPILYVLGDVAHLNKPQLAIVGSRNATKYGLAHAQRFAQQFTQAGITITRGLALGIDAASHRGALSANGSTVAVLATGIDKVYPPRHIELSKQIEQTGCLVSEFPIGTNAFPAYFPQRNRIISGLSLAVLVVEAALNSGSLITANYAIEQNREVFAIPGTINTPMSRGCHELIRQGAKLVESAEDVLEELASLLKYVIRDKRAGNVEQHTQMQLSASQQQLLEFIDYDSICVDEIIDRSGFASNAVGAMLFELELSGLIKAVPGGYARTLG
jgi:DNA processing protein